MADRRGIARVSIRVVSGVVGIAVAGLAIAGATVLPLPSFSAPVPVTTVKPVPADQQRVCPGPLLALASDAGAATAATAFDTPSTTYGTDGPAAETRRITPDSEAAAQDQAPTVLTVSTPATAGSPPLVAGAQVQDAATDDLAGLAAASCGEAAADSWLVAGSTALGQTSIVMLTNPTTVQATVSLTIFAETGRVDAPGATGIVVPPGGQKVIPLAGLAPSVSAPVVHVQTTGGQVLASLQQSFEQGIDPRGVELTAATASPSRQQIISGMRIANLAAVTAAQSGEGYGVDLPAVRVFVPGTEDADVTVGAVGENGTAAGSSYAATVKAGVVTEIPLDGLKDGNYTVTVNSSTPVVAAARTSVTSGKADDFAWFVASQPMDDRFLAAVPTGPSPVLHFANRGEKDQKVTITPENGKASTLLVPAEGAANSAATTGLVTVTGADGLVVSTSFSANGKLSSFALNPPGPLAAPLVVYPR
jgi:hypothetical protein